MVKVGKGARSEQGWGPAAGATGVSGWAPGKRTLTEALPTARGVGADASSTAQASSRGVSSSGGAQDLDVLHSAVGVPNESAPGYVGRPAAAAGYAADVDDHSIGESFARDLSDAVLEQTLEHLSQRRHRADLDPIAREVASANFEVLAAETARRRRPSGALDRDAVRTLIGEAMTSVVELQSVVLRIASTRDGLRNHPVTERFVEQAVERVTWVVDALSAGESYLELGSSAGGEAGAATLRMAATRAQAAHVGLAVLRPWCAFLQLQDRVAMLPLLQLEHRYRTLDAEQRCVDAVLAQLARFDPGDIAGAAAGIPGCVAALAAAFDTVLADVESARKIQRWAMIAQSIAEVAAFAGSLRGVLTLGGPRGGLSLPMPAVAGGAGVAALGQVAVSAEWLAAIRHLVEIGAISAAGAAEALRGRGLTAAMAQATDLPQAVKDLLGEGPTTDAMKVTNSSGAGATRPPRHHVLPQEERAFFEERGFTGDLDIDNFTIELQAADHQAQHGGGDWRMGRSWAGEWNRAVMDTLRKRETQLGRPLRAPEIMREVEWLMKERRIPAQFVPYRGE